MHTFLTVTATGTKFTLSTAGRNHGDAYKRAVGVANGCTVKHEGMPANNEQLGRAVAYWALKSGMVRKAA